MNHRSLSAVREAAVKASAVPLVARVAHGVDRLADLLAIGAHAGADLADVVLGLGQVGGIGVQRRGLGHDLDRALGDTVQHLHALGEGVDLFVQVVAHGVEQFVHRDEIAALHVPMRLLDRQSQRDRIRKGGVQFVDRGLAGVVGQALDIHSHRQLLRFSELDLPNEQRRSPRGSMKRRTAPRGSGRRHRQAPCGAFCLKGLRRRP